jgi:hypothetical protein
MLDLVITIYAPIFEEGVIPEVLFAIVSAILSSLGLGSIDSWLPLAFVFIVSGVTIWHLGKALNAKSGKVLVDMETGEHYRMGTGHSLFFIPMHYWGPVGLVLGFILTVATIVT